METKELEKLEGEGITCLDCSHYPCSANQDNHLPLCYSFEPSCFEGIEW